MVPQRRVHFEPEKTTDPSVEKGIKEKKQRKLKERERRRLIMLQMGIDFDDPSKKNDLSISTMWNNQVIACKNLLEQLKKIWGKQFSMNFPKEEKIRKAINQNPFRAFKDILSVLEKYHGKITQYRKKGVEAGHLSLYFFERIYDQSAQHLEKLKKNFAADDPEIEKYCREKLEQIERYKADKNVISLYAWNKELSNTLNNKKGEHWYIQELIKDYQNSMFKDKREKAKAIQKALAAVPLAERNTISTSKPGSKAYAVLQAMAVHRNQKKKMKQAGAGQDFSSNADVAVCSEYAAKSFNNFKKRFMKGSTQRKEPQQSNTAPKKLC